MSPMRFCSEVTSVQEHSANKFNKSEILAVTNWAEVESEMLKDSKII